MTYTPPAADAIEFSWQGAADYTSPDADAIEFSWEDQGAAGVGVIGIVGQSETESNYRAVGVGDVGIAGESIVSNSYQTIGIGDIGIVGQSIVSSTYQSVGVGVVGFVGLSETLKAFNAIGVGVVGLTGLSDTEINYRTVGVGIVGIAGQSLTEFGLKQIPAQWLSTHYHCYLTGTPDLELPIKSIQIRYSQDPDYRAFVSVVVPGLDEFQAEISARPNGRLKVYRIYNFSDGTNDNFLMIDVPMTSIRSDEGPKTGRTGTLSGSEVVSPVPPVRSVELHNPIFRGQSDAGLRYRCELDPRLRPGDTASIGGDSLTIRSIITMIDTRTCIMEIAE